MRVHVTKIQKRVQSGGFLSRHVFDAYADHGSNHDNTGLADLAFANCARSPSVGSKNLVQVMSRRSASSFDSCLNRLKGAAITKSPVIGDNVRLGTVRDRPQDFNPYGETWMKRDAGDGIFMGQKKNGVHIKGMRNERKA